MSSIPSISRVQAAVQHLKDIPIIKKTPLEKSRKLSEKYNANIYLKREDMQPSRSFKMRGAVNYYLKMTKEEKEKGVIVASDGNFSIACSFCAKHFKVKTLIIVPEVMQNMRTDQIQEYGQEYIEIQKHGDNFEEAYKHAQQISQETKQRVLHPFDHSIPIEANGTIAWEIMNDKQWDLDFVFTCIGGGGLAAGISIVTNELSPDTQVIGVEPEDSCSMSLSIKNKKVTPITELSRFCDGSAVKEVGKQCFDICKNNLSKVDTVSEGEISSAILQLYDNGIIVEPSGALALAALEKNREQIKGKNVVVMISGGNTDLQRLDIFKEIALMHDGLKYFFLINFPLRQGILKEFVKNCLSETDEISHIQFNKKVNREVAPAIIAIEVRQKNDINKVIENIQKMNLKYQIVNQNKELYDLLI